MKRSTVISITTISTVIMLFSLMLFVVMPAALEFDITTWSGDPKDAADIVFFIHFFASMVVVIVALLIASNKKITKYINVFRERLIWPLLSYCTDDTVAGANTVVLPQSRVTHVGGTMARLIHHNKKTWFQYKLKDGKIELDVGPNVYVYLHGDQFHNGCLKIVHEDDRITNIELK